MLIDYKRYPILFVDDEAANLVAFRYALEDQFSVLTATSGEEALRILKDNEIAIMLVDQRMPNMTGSELCAQAQAVRPDTLRMVVTAFADIHAAIDAVNRGQVVRYLVKPWRNEELLDVLQTGIDFVHMQRTMQEMELRLLRSSQAHAANAVHDELLHEISNPLAAVRLTLSHGVEQVDAALKALDEGTLDGLRASLREARDAQSDALDALDRLVALSRYASRGLDRPSSEEAVCEPARVVEATVRIVRRQVERVAALQVVIEPSSNVAMEPSALGQVVLNLVLNAAHAIESAGLRQRTIRVIVSETPSHTMVAVEDDGPGIAPEVLPRVFDAYFTTGQTGSGLGLSIVRDLVRRVGGDIKVQSTVGAGTRFDVLLPSAEARPMVRALRSV